MPKKVVFQCSISLHKFGFKKAKMGDLNTKMGKKCFNWQRVANKIYANPVIQVVRFLE